MKYLLITSAIQEELSGLWEFHNQNVKILEESYTIFLLPTGIGKLNSYASLCDWYFSNRLNHDIEMIFLGSCGYYGSPSLQEKFLYSYHFLNYDGFSLSGKAKSFSSISGLIETQPGLVGKYLIKKLNFISGIINTTDSVTLIDISKDYFTKIDPVLEHYNFPIFENLELYGIAKFVYKYQIPFVAFLSITNRVGKNGSKEWEKNYKLYSEKLNSEIKKYL